MPYNFNGIGRMMDYMIPIKNKSEFRPTHDGGLVITEALSRMDNCMKNRVWLRGDTYELQQCYLKLRARKKRNCFWGETTGQTYDVKRIHSGLPRKMVKSMAQVVLGDMRDVEFEEEAHTEVWQEIAKENDFTNLMYESLQDVLALGWGAYKYSFETAFTDKPIAEWYPAEQVEFVRHRGRIQEVVFSTNYEHKNNKYVLKERYGYGYILNNLYKDNVEVPLSEIPATSGMSDCGFAGGEVKNGEVIKKGDMMLAVPFILYSSAKYPGYGESIFDERETLFAALDRAVSQWDESVEAGSPKTGIDEEACRRDPNTGTPIVPEGLTRYFFLKGRRNGDGSSNSIGIETIQFDIPWQSYYETHASLIDSILMGFMSPATLGIGIGKIDSGESQREKEKMTMYTRAYIVEKMTEIVKQLAMVGVQSFYDYHEINALVSEPEVDFGDYANPAFEAVVETVTKAKQGGVMSVVAAVDELYGDSKSEEWKAEEVERIKTETGVVTMDEPSFGDYSFLGNTEQEEEDEIPEDNEEELEEE